MDDPARLVAAGYDAVADAYAALEQDGSEWPRSRRVADLVRRLADGCSVLDLGCGNGVPVARDLVAAGLTVTGVDVSEGQVRRARAAVPNATFVVSDLRALTFPEAAFDAVVSLYAIEHVPRSDHLDILRSTLRWLRPGGLLLLATEDADEEGVVAEWLGAPMFFSARDAQTVCALAERAGLEVLQAEVEAQLEQGVEVPYLWLLARRPHDRAS